jgi:hypothetical protein
MSLEVGSDKGGVVSQRRVLRVTGDDAKVVDSMERDLCCLQPSAEGRRGG